MSTGTRFRAGTRKAKRRPSLRATRLTDREAGWENARLFRVVYEDSAQPRRTIRHPAECWPGVTVAWIAGAGARAKARSDKGREAGERGKRR